MKKCNTCGAELNDDAKFCGKCGAEQEIVVEAEEVNEEKSNEEKTEFEKKFEKFTDTKDSTSEMDKKDIEENKAITILAYFSWLLLIPLLVKPDSKFARYHCNQGIILAIIELVTGLIQGILVNWILLNISYGLYVVGNVIFSIIDIFFLVLAIIGVMNVVNGKAKEIPVFGKIRLIK